MCPGLRTFRDWQTSISPKGTRAPFVPFGQVFNLLVGAQLSMASTGSGLLHIYQSVAVLCEPPNLVERGKVLGWTRMLKNFVSVAGALETGLKEGPVAPRCVPIRSRV